MKKIEINLSTKPQLAILTAIISVVLISGGYLFYRFEKNRIYEQKESHLASIASLKSNQIREWFLDDIADVQTIAENIFLDEVALNYIRTNSPADSFRLSGILRQIRLEHGTNDIILASTDGKLIGSSSGQITELDDFEKKSIKAAFSQNQAVSTDLFKIKHDGEEMIFISFVAALLNHENKPFAALITRFDPAQFLYPLIERWPVPSQTAESFIFRVENDSVLYLNKLKHKANTAVNLKIPLSKTDLPAAMAARGVTGLISGKDYRNVDVVAYVEKINDTPWFIISKIDKTELLSEMPLLITRIVAFVLIIILGVAFGVRMVYKLRQESIYRELYKKEKEIWQQQEKFKVTMDSLGNGVIITDTNAKIQYMNSLSEKLTGWNYRESRGRSLGEVYKVRSEETGLKENNILEKVMKHGIVKELTNHTLLISKSGKEIPVMDTGAPVYDSDGSILGIVITFQDETEKRLQQRLIKESEDRFRSSLDNLIEGCQIISFNFTYLYLNKAAIESSRKPKEKLIGKTMMQCYPDIENTEMFSALKKCMELRESVDFENVFTYPDGKEEVFKLRFEPVPEGVFILSENISEAKKAQDFILKFKMGIELSNDAVFITDLKGNITYVNQAFERIFGYHKHDAIGKTPRLIKSGQFTDEDYEKLWGKLLSREPVNHEIVNKTKNGKLVYIEASVNPIINDTNKVIGYLAIERDITLRKLAEKAQSQLTAIIEATPDFIGIANPEGNSIFINNAGRQMLGIKPDEDIANYKITDFHPDWVGKLIMNEGVPAAIQHGSWRGETVLLQKNGNEMPISQIILAHKTDEGEVEYYSTIGRDITERKKFETELTEKTTMLESFFDNTLTLIALLDKDFNFIRVNQAYAAVDEKDVDFFTGKNHFELYPSNAKEIFEEVVRSKTAYQIMERPFTYERNPERGVTYWDWSLVPLLKADGEVDSLIFTLLNVTVRVKAKAEMVENEKFLSTLFNSVNDVIFTVSMPDRIIRSANQAVNDLFGYDTNEIVGQQTLVLYPLEKSFIEYGQQLSDATQKNKPFVRAELTLQKKDGQKVYCEVQTSFLKQTGEPDLVISVLRDITERKEMMNEIIKAKEKAEESDRLKSAFLANMSHEIRTPMNGILGFTELLLTPDLSGEEKESYIKIVHQSGQRMLNTVTDIVEISKIEAGMVNVSENETDLNEGIEELFNFFKPEAEKKGLKLILDTLLPVTEKNITTDRNKFDSILSNLIKNAIKYTDSGIIKMGCRQKDRFIEFYIKDTGIGIPTDRIEAIFNRFEQADIEDTRVFEGSGLGLAIAKSYVEMLGGNIWVKSREAEGSTFYFTLPVKDNTEEKSIIREEKSFDYERVKTNVKKLKILIAEDDETSLSYISLIVNDYSTELLKAKTGIEAIELCRKNHDIDLILMDIKMPGIDGHEATKQIREFNKDIIVIAQTAYGLTGDREKAIESGCNDYIAKPINKTELQALIQKHFGE